MADLQLSIVCQALDKVSAPFRSMDKATQSLRSSVKATAERLKGLNQTSQNLKSFEKLKDASDRNAQTLRKAQMAAQMMALQLRDAQQQLKATENPTKEMQSATRKMREEMIAAANQVKKLKERGTDLAQQSQETRQKLLAVGVDTRNTAAAHRKLAADMDRVRAVAAKEADALRKIHERMEALNKAKAKYAKSMELAGNMSLTGQAGLNAGRQVLGGLQQVMAPGITFENSMSKVQALTRVDKASAEFAKMSALAQELGATTMFSATEAADGMGFLAMAGFKVNDILSAMPGMLDLAKASGVDLARTADIASNILSGFGMEASQMDKVGDVLTATFTQANVDLEMLGQTMKYVAPIAKAAGMSLEEAAAMAGLLGNIGIQDSQAGTALRAIQTRMANLKGPVGDAFDALKINAHDAQGNVRNMVELLAEVAEKTEGMGSGERLKIFTDIAGMEAGSAFTALVEKGGSGEIRKFANSMMQIDGYSHRVAKTMGDNVVGALDEVSSAWEGLNITLFESQSGPLRELLLSVAEMISGLNKWTKENPKLTATLVKAAAVLGTLLVASGGLMQIMAGILGPMALVKMSVTALGIKFGFLNATMWANPIGVVIAACVALAGVIYMIYDNWGGIVTWFTAKLDRVSAAFDEGFVQGVWTLFKEFNPTTIWLESIDGMINYLFGIDLKSWFMQQIKGITDAMPDWFKDMVGIEIPEFNLEEAVALREAGDKVPKPPESLAGPRIEALTGPRAIKAARLDEAGFAGPRPELSDSRAYLRTVAAQNTTNNNAVDNSTTTITIVTQPGQDNQAIGNDLMRQLEDRRGKRSPAAALYDLP